jgi:hypothetical protein
MWHCTSCYTVFRTFCTKTLADRDSRRGWWHCPSCKVDSRGAPEAGCWCGKKRSIFASHVELNFTNSCAGECKKMEDCPHGNHVSCEKMCHPGPCDWPCSATCVNLPVLPPRQTKGPQKLYKEIWPFNAPPSSWRKIIFNVVLLVILGLMMVVILSHHFHWNRYPEYFEWVDSTGYFFILFGFGGAI